jgi:alkanesulfonate monooxygenase SsuD/methylene tetrahydromethanopterin reductase-like flavin-dependent oxidoreductase (luciferase family)
MTEVVVDRTVDATPGRSLDHPGGGEAGPAVRFGAQLWSQASDWQDFLAAAVAADEAGWDGIWTWDHLHAIFGPWEQPIFEGWSAMTAVAARTSRATVGLMVGANTFRNPGHTAKLAATLDHVSGGRAVLGIGGAWFAREHEAFGIDFGASVGERLDRLDEAVGLVRRLLDGERFDHAGRFYRFTDALLAPLPVQAHLPILVGGNGPRKTLRTVARLADAWNTNGTVDEVAARDVVLREHCAAVGRDPAAIERTVSFPIVIRDDASAAERAFRAICRHNGTPDLGAVPTFLGSPRLVAAAIRPYVELGFRTIIVRLPAPYDAETIARIGEVREALAG